MSSRGQVVIPQQIREKLHAEEGAIFAVLASGDTIILKKLGTPSKEELIKDLKELAKESRASLESRGFKESDIIKASQRARKRN